MNAVDENSIKYIKQLSPLVLAFVGDSVFDLFIRSRLAMKKNESPHKMHIKATSYVKAKAQGRTALCLYDMLDNEEKKIFRRGRNSNPATIPKNADMIDYRHATAFETVLGYLYLIGSHDRLNKLMNMAAEIIEQEGAVNSEKE